MRSKYLVIIFLFFSSLFLFNCSEIQDEITQPPILEGVHPDGFGKTGSNNFHSFNLKSNNWDLVACQKCHASDYSGGIAEVSCLSCHNSSAGPEACNTCHGIFSDETKIAPPNDLNNNYETSEKGVGAHATHLSDNNLSLRISCFECHPSDVGEGTYVAAHIDGLPAEINFGIIASSGLTPPIYNNDLSCSNTYCHGNFEFKKEDSESQYAYADSLIVGNNFSPLWILVDETQAACGTCHGQTNELGEIISPTPKGHFGSFDETNCKNCHSSTFNEDGSLNKETHINGEKNLN